MKLLPVGRYVIEHGQEPPGRDVIAHGEVGKPSKANAGPSQLAQSLTVAGLHAAGRRQEDSLPVFPEWPAIGGALVAKAEAVVRLKVGDAARFTETFQVRRSRDNDHRRLSEFARHKAGVL